MATTNSWSRPDANKWANTVHNMKVASSVLNSGEGYVWNAWGEEGYRHWWKNAKGEKTIMLFVVRQIEIWTDMDDASYTFPLREWNLAVSKLEAIAKGR